MGVGIELSLFGRKANSDGIFFGRVLAGIRSRVTDRFVYRPNLSYS